MATCEDVLNPLLTELASINAQFPLLLFSENNCQGKMYPPVGEYNLWNQYIDVNTIGFSEINSLYCPPQTLLQVWSKNQQGYYSVTGPQTIPNTNAQLASWVHWDGSPCNPGETYCNKKVNWTFDQDIYRLRIVIQIPWTVMLHNMAANKQPLQMNGTVFTVNNDALFAEVCRNPGNRFLCHCYDAYQVILAQHAAAASSSYVNLLQNGCNPLAQYVPTGALVGQGTPEECTTMIQAQLLTGTFPTLGTPNAPINYICANQIYVNAFKDGAVDPLARVDDSEDDLLEKQEMNSTTPSYAYWIIGVLLLLAFLMFFLCLLERSFAQAKWVRSNIKRYKFAAQTRL